jgi:hypothetical protein
VFTETTWKLNKPRKTEIHNRDKDIMDTMLKREAQHKSYESDAALKRRERAGDGASRRRLKNRNSARRSRMQQREQADAQVHQTRTLMHRMDELRRQAYSVGISGIEVNMTLSEAARKVESLQSRFERIQVTGSSARCQESDADLQHKADSGDKQARRKLRNRQSARRDREKKLQSAAEREYNLELAVVQHDALTHLITMPSVVPPTSSTTLSGHKRSRSSSSATTEEGSEPKRYAISPVSTVRTAGETSGLEQPILPEQCGGRVSNICSAATSPALDAVTAMASPLQTPVSPSIPESASTSQGAARITAEIREQKRSQQLLQIPSFVFPLLRRPTSIPIPVFNARPRPTQDDIQVLLDARNKQRADE